MGKKGSWFSAIKRVFTHSSKEKVADGTEKRSQKKKKGLGKLKHGGGHSFIPLFREPSSIEKILGEAERENHIRNYRPTTPPEQSKIPNHVTPLVRNATLLWDDDPPRATTPPRPPSPPRAASPPRNTSRSTLPSKDATQPAPPRAASPPPRRAASPPPRRAVSPPRRTASPPPRRPASPPRAVTPVNEVTPARVPSPKVQRQRPEPTMRNQHMCATRIQTAYRGYMARRSYRALRGLVRLQGVVKGQSVKRQTANALKCMQMLVRVQNQIQTRRIQMLESQTQQRLTLSRNEKDLESAFGKWLSENQEDWDDSTLTKEEIEARMQRKFDAIVRRERAMAYAYSHQSSKSTPRIGHGALADFRTGGYPYWWNWLEQRQPPPSMTPTTNVPRSPLFKNNNRTPTRATLDFKASPLPQSSNIGQLTPGFENMEISTPKSTRSSIPLRTRQASTPPGRFPQRFSRGSAANSPFNGAAFRDDDSLTSCPPFSVPRYMTPTASAQAKLKGGRDQQFPESPSSVTTDVSKRRMSFPLGQGNGGFKWNKGSLFSNKETSSQRGLGKIPTSQSVGNLSIDSSLSMPASVGRKPFNRFV